MTEYSPPASFKQKWTISEQKLQSLINRRALYSPINDVLELSGLQYQIELRLSNKRNEYNELKNNAGIYLTIFNMDNRDTKLCIKYVIFIKSAGYVKYCDSFQQNDEYSWGFANLFLYNDLLDEEKKFLVDGELTIEVKGMIFCKIESKSEKVKSENCLSELLWKSNEEEKDFVIVAGKDDAAKAELKIHKCVLSAHSSVFKTMLKIDMKEKAENKVDIIDFDVETVKAAIEFCYDQNIFGKHDICLEWKNIIALHRFADKYDITNLKDKIELSAPEWFLSDDICQITNAVQDLNSVKLQDLCFQYLLTSLREGIPIKDMNALDKEYANGLLQKASSIAYC